MRKNYTQSEFREMTHAHLFVVELNDLPRLGRLHIGDAEQALREVLVVLGGEELHRQADVAQLHPLALRLRPIWMAFDLFLLHNLVEHENCF